MERIGALAVSQGSRLGLRPSDEPAPIIEPDQLPALAIDLDREMSDRVTCWENGTRETGTPVIRRPHSAAERMALEQRVTDLRGAVASMESIGRAGRDKLVCAVAGMLNGFPVMQRYDEKTALAIAAGYLWTARERPPWAIAQAAEMVRSGKAGLNLSYCPSEPEFNALVTRCVEPYARLLARTERILLAKVDPPPGPMAALPRKPLPSYADGKHATRVAADLESRRIQRERTETDPPEAA